MIDINTAMNAIAIAFIVPVPVGSGADAKLVSLSLSLSRSRVLISYLVSNFIFTSQSHHKE